MTAGPSELTRGVHSFEQEFSSLTEDHTGSRRTMLRRIRRLESRQASDTQTSLTLDSKVISKVVEEPLGTEATTGTYATSLTSSNNFINFCATVNLQFTNGKQIEESSCNAAPMGIIPSINHIPSLKFQFPLNGAVLAINDPFTIRLGVNNLATGNSVNSQTNYLAAPQQVDSSGLVLGHTAIVIEKLETLNQTAPTNPSIFDFFMAAINQLTNGFHGFNVTNGLPAGSYRLSSITTDANHHPIMVPLLQHGSIDDAVYVSVISMSLFAFDPDYNPVSSTQFTVRLGGARSIKREAHSDPVFPRQNGNTSTSNSNGDAQSSTTLLSSQVATGFASDGLETPVAGRVASLTSRNNFINYCLASNKALTNGQQSGGDSCNPIPIGTIPSSSKMPSFKFLYPKNFDTIPPNEAFTIRLGFRNMDIEMTDPQTRYLSAPQQLAADGSIKGYAQVVIEALTSLNQTSFTDPLKVAFAAPMNGHTGDGVLVTDASKGLPAGFYRMSSRALTANHAPLAYPVLQKGAVDDVVYFQVGDGGSGSTAANSISATAPAAISVRATSVTTTSGSPGGGNSGNIGGESGAAGVSPMVLGAAIGGSIGGLILVALIAILIILRRRRKREETEPTFDIPQPAYPVPYADDPQTSNVDPYIGASTSSIGRSKDGKETVLRLENPPEVAGSSSRLSLVSIAPSYHTVAPERS
ncbi:hypothetical protein PQX77_002198 [Marasmius sp. AFHP31]|nr:hypothetical protein PQX77_002198 [Marasmius sp. AFHP31]